MSDEQRKDDETEVDGHMTRHGANDEPAEKDEVEGHMTRHGANDDTAKDGDGEVEGHGAHPPKYGVNDEDEVEGHMHRAG